VAYESDDFALGDFQVETVQSRVKSARVSEADALEANGFLDRKAGFAGRTGKDRRLQGQEFVKIFNEEQASVDFARSFKERTQENLRLLEGLKAEQEIAQPRLSGESPVQHPSQSYQAAAPRQASGAEFGYGSLPDEAKPPFAEICPQVLKGLAVVGSKIEEA